MPDIKPSESILHRARFLQNPNISADERFLEQDVCACKTSMVLAAILEHLDKEAEGRRIGALWHTPESVQTGKRASDAEVARKDPMARFIMRFLMDRNGGELREPIRAMGAENFNLAVLQLCHILVHKGKPPNWVDEAPAETPTSEPSSPVRMLMDLAKKWRERAAQCHGSNGSGVLFDCAVELENEVGAAAFLMDAPRPPEPPPYNAWQAYQDRKMGTFLPGDVVQLKSGGPRMTVRENKLGDPGQVACEWFENGHYSGGWVGFDPRSLRRVNEG